jgi:hypothetical protein
VKFGALVSPGDSKSLSMIERYSGPYCIPRRPCYFGVRWYVVVLDVIGGPLKLNAPQQFDWVSWSGEVGVVQ